jgi:hypothetical protein
VSFVVVVGATSVPVNSTARYPCSGVSYSCTLLTPLAQALSVGTPVTPSFWKTWTCHTPRAGVTNAFCAQHACSPPYGALGSPQPTIGTMGTNSPAVGIAQRTPVGETSTYS